MNSSIELLQPNECPQTDLTHIHSSTGASYRCKAPCDVYAP